MVLKFEGLSDDFETLSAAPLTTPVVSTEATWRVKGNVQATRGHLTLTADTVAAQIASAQPYDLRASSVFLKVAASPGASVALALSSGETTFHRIVLAADELMAEMRAGQVNPVVPIGSYADESPDEINWWRIRAVGGQVSYAVSFDGVFWDERAVLPAGFDLGALTASIVASSGTVSIESFNVPANQFGDRIYRGLPEGYRDRDPETGFTLLKYLRAMGEAFAIAYQVTAGLPGEHPWSIALDVDRAPDYVLPWLAVLAGVRVPRGTPAKNVRRIIKEQANTRRGTRPAFESAIKAELSGSKRVEIVERDGSAYTLTIRTENEETPDPDRVLAAAMANKPAGIKLNYIVNGGRSWDEAKGTWNAAGSTTWDSAAYQAL